MYSRANANLPPFVVTEAPKHIIELYVISAETGTAGTVGSRQGQTQKWPGDGHGRARPSEQRGVAGMYVQSTSSCWALGWYGRAMLRGPAQPLGWAVGAGGPGARGAPHWQTWQRARVRGRRPIHSALAHSHRFTRCQSHKRKRQDQEEAGTRNRRECRKITSTRTCQSARRSGKPRRLSFRGGSRRPNGKMAISLTPRLATPQSLRRLIASKELAPSLPSSASRPSKY